MKTLFMDTSASTMRVCLMEDGKILQQDIQQGAKNHSTLLMPAVERLMTAQGWKPAQLSNIWVAKGPGSYTGVRMGVTTAKTLAWTLQCPLCLVSSLEVLASQSSEGKYIIPIMDARRHCVYGALYERTDDGLKALIVDGYYDFNELMNEVSTIVTCQDDVVMIGEINAFSDEVSETMPFISQQSSNDITTLESLSNLHVEIIEGAAVHNVTPSYLKKVEAEEKWEAQHEVTDEERQSFVEKTK